MDARRGIVPTPLSRGAVAAPWLFVTCVALVGVADAVVLELTRSYFGSGYNGFALRAASERVAFFVGGAALDVAMIAAVWCVVLGLARCLHARPSRSLFWAAVVGAGVPLAFDVAMHRLHRVLGDVLGLGLLVDLAAGSWTAALGEAAQDLPPIGLLLAASAVGLTAWTIAIARAEARWPRLREVSAPRWSRLALTCSAGVALGAALLGVAERFAPALHYGWSTKPGGRAVIAALGTLSDVDGDGYGWLSVPGDPAPFDGKIHPFAIDVPGNGIDEDGVAGDSPPAVDVPQPVSIPIPGSGRPGPSVVLLFLESFRGDVVGSRERGIQVTPNLDRLAGRGISARAYTHTPATWPSRASLFQGRVAPLPKGDTLVDDFLARGYEVAWFSGQHDGLAEDRARLGLEKADPFFDARFAVAQRTSRSARPISLQVSWKTVVSATTSFLEGRQAGAPPLLLYVNIVDTHFPYWHRELDDILGTGELARSSIRPENRAALWRAYLNAAANVDRAIGRVVASARAKLGPSTIVVVTGDHGQSFYENGFLGHGQSLDDAQTLVPFVVSGAPPTRLPLPLALSDVRGLLAGWIDGVAVAPSEAARSEIFQHLGDLSHPVSVALRSRTSLRLADPSGASEVARPEAARVLRVWEALRRDSRE